MTVGIYAKAIAGATVAGLTAALTALDDGTITAYEWTVITGTTIAALAGVWAVPNTPTGITRYGKAFTAAAVAGLGAVGAGIVDGAMTQADWVTVAIAVAGGLGVTYTVPNSAHSDGYL